MILSSLPPIVEVFTVGAVALVFISAVVLLFYCTPSSIWRRRESGQAGEDGKFEGIECEHGGTHTWTKAATNEPAGTSSQRIAYYGTLSLSAQNSPTRHLRSISATNPPTHFLSPSHIRSPRRNSSPIAQQQNLQQPQAVGGSSRNLSPHTHHHMFDLNPHPVQPPYWDPESQQYFHCYGYDSNHASPRRNHRSKSPARTPPSTLTTATATGSPGVHQKRTSPPVQAVNPLTAQLVAAAAAAGHPKKLTDYSNLYLPQAPKVKSRLLESVDASAATAAAAAGNVKNMEISREKEDILEVMQDKEDNFQVILNKNIPKIRTPPENLDDFQEKEEQIFKESPTAQKEQQVKHSQMNVMSEKHEILAQLAPQSEEHGEEKHVSEVN